MKWTGCARCGSQMPRVDDDDTCIACRGDDIALSKSISVRALRAYQDQLGREIVNRKGNENALTEARVKLTIQTGRGDGLAVDLARTVKERDRLLARCHELERELAVMRSGKLDSLLGSLFGGSGNVPAEMVEDMIRLCHPDRHADPKLNERATRATAWLMKNRRKKG